MLFFCHIGLFQDDIFFETNRVVYLPISEHGPQGDEESCLTVMLPKFITQIDLVNPKQ